MIIANSALLASLASYHLISNEHSRTPHIVSNSKQTKKGENSDWEKFFGNWTETTSGIFSLLDLFYISSGIPEFQIYLSLCGCVFSDYGWS